MSRIPDRKMPPDVVSAVGRAIRDGAQEDAMVVPLSILGPFEDFCLTVSNTVGVAPEMVLPVMLGAVSAVVGGHVVVKGRAWLEPINIWVAVIADPGERKSPVFQQILSPVYDIQARWQSAAAPEIRQAKARKEIAVRKAEAAAKEAARSFKESNSGDVTDEEMIASRLLERADAISVPAVPTMIVDDFTPEKLVDIMAEQGGSTACVSDEGGNFFGSPTRYQKGIPLLDAVLKSWGGNPVTVHRVSRPSTSIPRPILTVCLALQPVLLHDVSAGPAWSRGLMSRFLYFFPRSLAGTRPVDTRPVREDLVKRWTDALDSLAEEIWQIRSSDDPQPRTLTLSVGAQNLYRDFRSSLEKGLQDEGFRLLVNGFGGKFHGQILRLAAIGHCLRHGAISGTISPDIMAETLELAPYLVHQAYTAGDLIQRERRPSTDQERMIRWAKNREEPDFSSREVQRGLSWHADRAERVLADLIDEGRIEKVPRLGKEQRYRFTD